MLSWYSKDIVYVLATLSKSISFIKCDISGFLLFHKVIYLVTPPQPTPSPLQFINRRCPLLSGVFCEKEILQKTTCLTSHSILAEVIGFSILLNAIRGAGRLYYETCLEIANGYARNGQAPRKFIITVLDFLMQVQRPQRLLVIMRMEKGWTWLNWFFRYFVCFFLGPPIW